MPAQNIHRPVPLVCEHCLTVIAHDDPCTWRELPAAPGALVLSVGYAGTHDDCPEHAFEHWSNKRLPNLPIEEIFTSLDNASQVTLPKDGASREADGDGKQDVLEKHGHLTAIDLEFAARLHASRRFP